MKRELWLIGLLISAITPSLGNQDTNKFERLTLEQAIEIAERMHPQLAEARALVEAAAGRTQQAGTFPNPEAIAGAQQIPFERGSNQREYLAGIAQPIPLGGRLGKARDAESLERVVRERGLEVTQRDLHKKVQGAFATALYQEKAFATQNEIARSYQQLLASVKARVELGDAIASELARAEMELARAHLELQRSKSLREQAFLALAGSMGNPQVTISSLDGSMENSFDLPSIEGLVAALSDQPEIRLAQATVRASKARIDLAKAERIPDIKVEALYHRLEATRENTFDLGVAVAIPLFDRSRGKLRAARAETAAAEARAQATELEFTSRLREAHAKLTSALASSKSLKDEILPRAEKVRQVAEARYEAGDASLSEVVPVRRDWAEAELAYLESLRDVMHAWAELKPFLPNY